MLILMLNAPKRIYNKNHPHKTKQNSNYILDKWRLFYYTPSKERYQQRMREENADRFAVIGVVERQVQEHVWEEPADDSHNEREI